MTIAEGFLEDLRKLDSDGMSDRLNSSDPQVRVRPAADMRCLISLVDHLIKPTRFRKEIRVLRITQTIEEFYRSTSDTKEARQQAEQLARRTEHVDLSRQADFQTAFADAMIFPDDNQP